jgi:alkylation response protein AidB-like acyl-CoA dehydrogenase
VDLSAVLLAGKHREVHLIKGYAAATHLIAGGTRRRPRITGQPAARLDEWETRMTATDTPTSSDHVSTDVRGQNFWRTDPAFRSLLRNYLPAELFAHLEPHFDRLGELSGDRLDALATVVDRHKPILHPRDRFGRDEDWIEYHPAYRELESVAYGEFGIHTMCHRAGVLGWDEPLPLAAKFAFVYLFVQAEFGLMCPVNVTDSVIHVLSRFASPALREATLPRLMSQDMQLSWKGAQWMTEKAGGSDVGAVETVAEHQGLDAGGLDVWKLTGEKWFASCTDADVALVLARPVGAPSGTRGLALFAMLRQLPDGSRNSYRIARLKDKLGTHSLASGEVVLDGAVAYLVGEADRGMRQMLEMVNLSRQSHGVRAAGMMRRSLNEALAAARSRTAFGKAVIEQPLMRRQLLKLMLPTEQALSMTTYTSHLMDAGQDELVRLLTPLVKFRSNRDNVRVAQGAMEARGGNGYIEDWVQARILRDAPVLTLWEGTSSINALDVVTRAVHRQGAHDKLAAALHARLAGAQGLSGTFRDELCGLVDRVTELIGKVGADPEREHLSRTVSSSLYHVTSAVLLACEGAEFGSAGHDARRILLARLVISHRLRPSDPLDPIEPVGEGALAELLLRPDPVPLSVASELVG